MVLIGNDSTSHAKACVAENAHDSSEGFSFASPPYLVPIFVDERNDMVETMATDVVCAVGVILEAGRAADVDGAADDEVAGICT